jgi:hypothetical protein
MTRATPTPRRRVGSGRARTPERADLCLEQTRPRTTPPQKRRRRRGHRNGMFTVPTTGGGERFRASARLATATRLARIISVVPSTPMGTATAGTGRLNGWERLARSRRKATPSTRRRSKRLTKPSPSFPPFLPWRVCQRRHASMLIGMQQCRMP